MAGSPGSGKTLLARAVPGILPEMSIEESLEVTKLLGCRSTPRQYTVHPARKLFNCVHPYPCGYYGDAMKPCSCAHALVTKYQKRISGPLLDHIDIHIEVPRVDHEKLSGGRIPTP
jgi:predicted ATPase with chaperone activity